MQRIATLITRYWVPLTAAAMLVIVGWFFIADLRVKYRNSYQTYYFAAKALETGGDLYASHVPGSRPEYVYPPLFAFTFIPLSHLQVGTATRVWLVVNVGLTLLALGLGTAEMMRRFRVSGGARMLIGLGSGAFLLSVGEVKTEWATGQTDTLILAAFVLALRWLDRLPAPAGAVLGFAANIKYQTLVALPWMLVRRRWRAAAAVALAALGFALIPALATGWDENLRNLGTAFAGVGKFFGVHRQVAAATVDVAWSRSISITSAIARLLETLRGDSSKAMAVSGLVALGFLGVVAGVYRSQSFRLFSVLPAARRWVPENGGMVAIEWLGLMVSWVAFGPEVSRRHMFVLILLHALVLAILANPEGRFPRKPLILGLVVWQLGLRLPPSDLHLLQGPGELWNRIGGPSWCLLFLYTVLIWSGLRWTQTLPGAEIPGDSSAQPRDRSEPLLPGR